MTDPLKTPEAARALGVSIRTLRKIVALNPMFCERTSQAKNARLLFYPEHIAMLKTAQNHPVLMRPRAIQPVCRVKEVGPEEAERRKWEFCLKLANLNTFAGLNEVKGLERAKAARSAMSEFPPFDFKATMYRDRMGEEILPDEPGVYMLMCRLKGLPITLYVGESVNIASRFHQHFVDPGELAGRISKLEHTHKAIISQIALAGWYIEHRIRRTVESVVINATGAALEYRDRKVHSCIPSEWAMPKWVLERRGLA